MLIAQSRVADMLIREALVRVSLSPHCLWQCVGAHPKSEHCHRQCSEESPHGTLYLHPSEKIIKDKIARISKQNREKSSKNHAAKLVRTNRQLNACWKRICSDLQIHGIQISQLEVHQGRTIINLWKLRRIFSDFELSMADAYLQTEN
jgi:hypothetical protein